MVSIFTGLVTRIIEQVKFVYHNIEQVQNHIHMYKLFINWPYNQSLTIFSCQIFTLKTKQEILSESYTWCNLYDHIHDTKCIFYGLVQSNYDMYVHFQYEEHEFGRRDEWIRLRKGNFM